LTLEQDVSAVDDEYYEVKFTIEGIAAGSVTPKVGGQEGLAESTNGAKTQYLKATGTGNLIFTPTTDFDGTLDDISVKLITPTDEIINIENGTTDLEIRVGVDNKYNMFLGYQTGMYVNSLADYNVFLGGKAGQYHISGDKNTFFGNGTGTYNSTGKQNTFIGSDAGFLNKTGDNNMFLGVYSGWENRTADNNVGIGYATLYRNRKGEKNVAIGSAAGKGISSSDYSNNVFIGYQAGNSVTTGSDNIIIGYDEDMPAGDTSNHLNIGGLIYGDLSGGSVGIGTTTISADLDIGGGSATHIDGTDDILVKGDIEVDGTIYTDQSYIYFKTADTTISRCGPNDSDTWVCTGL